jgi:hypothetical protein
LRPLRGQNIKILIAYEGNPTGFTSVPSLVATCRTDPLITLDVFRLVHDKVMPAATQTTKSYEKAALRALPAPTGAI